MASGVEEDFGRGKLEQFEKRWGLPSEKQRFSIRIWNFEASWKQK